MRGFYFISGAGWVTVSEGDGATVAPEVRRRTVLTAVAAG